METWRLNTNILCYPSSGSTVEKPGKVTLRSLLSRKRVAADNLRPEALAQSHF